MLVRENFGGPPVCVRTRLQGRTQTHTGRHVWHNSSTLLQESRARYARLAGRTRVDLVDLVDLVYLVSLVCLVEPD